MRPKNYSSMHIQDFSVYVHLGCSKEERTNSQEVRFSVDLEFNEPPPGEKTDQLSETVCYLDVCQTIKDYVTKKEFQLVESMAYDSLQLLKHKFPNSFIHVSAHKVRPPVENLRGGVKYVCRG